ncbi:endonuclease/exonuclease/phosphatase family protein [Altericroceibacterium xinjiangense]|uniref:endonuclease/exonuclease/phosphatase family protein n=1 Tax=Altericroceibacterium xinjiangense TaxID=762261 RepID=UPI000F7E5E1F|nr:endonuclease/exonuclease/phosphatase family protein [Altericroceibacterium xinjiangense]
MRLARDDGDRKAPQWLRVVLWVLGLGSIAVALIPLVRGDTWWIRILAFPQVQVTIVLMVVAILTALFLNLRRTPPKLLLAAVLATIIYQLTYLLPYTPVWAKDVRTAEACAAEDRVRVLVLNVLHKNQQSEPVLDLVSRVNPDMFLAMETDYWWADALEPVKQAYPHVVSAPRDDAWGMMLFSRLPLSSPQVRHPVEGYVPAIESGVNLPSGKSFQFYGMHPKPPAAHDTTRGDAYLMQVAREIGQNNRPAMLAGDLNDVPWGWTNQDFQEASGMQDPRVGRAFDATFTTSNPLARWPLDHAYVTPHFGIVGFDPLEDVGSDHFPLLADVCLNGQAGR